MIRKIQISVCCAMFVLTCLVSVADTAGAKTIKATATIEFETASGATASSYYFGQTMYVHIEATAGSGIGPDFIFTLKDGDGDIAYITRWYASSLSVVIAYAIAWNEDIGEWEAKLTYSDLDNTRITTIAKEYVEVLANGLPTATIDLITPNPAVAGTNVQFSGSGTDDGYIVSREWRSSIDGFLSTYPTWSTSSLSIGVHTITFTVTDNYGVSASDTDTLEILISGNTPPVAWVDDGTSTWVEWGRSASFDGDASDADGDDPYDDCRWELWTSVNGQLGAYVLTFSQGISSPHSFIVKWNPGEYFLFFYAYDGEDWSEPSTPWPFEVAFREWYECPQEDGLPPTKDDIRVFERDVDRDGIVDSVNMFMDFDYHIDSSIYPPVEPDVTRATFWIELQGFIFAHGYLLHTTWMGESIPEVVKSNTGYYGSDQQLVKRAVFNVAYNEPIEIPDEEPLVPLDMGFYTDVHDLLGTWVFCNILDSDLSVLNDATYTDLYSCLSEFSQGWNVMSDLGYWPEAGDGDGIWEWMSELGYPDTSDFTALYSADLNGFPDDGWCILFQGEYNLIISEGIGGTRLEEWSTWNSEATFGFWYIGDVVIDDDFSDGDLDEWAITGNYVVVDMNEIEPPCLKVARGAVAATALAARYFAPQYGSVVAEAKMMVPSFSTYYQYFYVGGGQVTFAFHPSDSYTPYPHFSYYTSTGYWSDLTGLELSAGQTYNVRFDIDTLGSTFVIYVDGTRLGGTILLRGTSDYIDSVSFCAGYAGTNLMMYVDGVMVATTT